MKTGDARSWRLSRNTEEVNIVKQLNFIGTGGATNAALGGNCCYIKSGDSLLMIDVCGEATKKLLDCGAFSGVKRIYIAITHAHYDHVGGLGVLIWYSNFILNLIPQIICSDELFQQTLNELLTITGVERRLYEFVDEKTLDLDFSIHMQPTPHSSDMQCFGIMFEDKDGKYYYTGDTRDIDYVRKLSDDASVKTIYTEVAEQTFDMHIKYEDLIDLDRNKLVLMHFGTLRLYERAKRDGFRVAQIAGADSDE